MSASAADLVANGDVPLPLGAVDVVELAITGVLLGSGIKLFDHLAHTPIRLQPTRVIPSRGITHVRYDVQH